MRRAALVAALLVAGCGGGGHRSSSSDAAALRRLHDVQRALLGLHSFHVAGWNTEPSGTTRISGDYSTPGRFRATIAQGTDHAELILLPGAVYLRANSHFWTHSTHSPPRLVALVHDRWVTVPPTKSLTRIADDLNPKTISRCMAHNVGTVRRRSSSTLNGTPVDVVEAVGDLPGSAPGLMYIAAKGPALPLRLVQTGPHKPGGTKDPACDSDKPDLSTKSDVRFSRFDEPVRITAPAGALSLGDIEQKLGTTVAT